MIHETGIHLVNVDFCGCERRQPSRTQLLRAEVMPSTTSFPKTGATFRVLELFEMLSATGRLSNHEFYNALERITDNTGISVPKVRFHLVQSVHFSNHGNIGSFEGAIPYESSVRPHQTRQARRSW